MKELYTINEIINAVEELENKDKYKVAIKSKIHDINKEDIPSTTLKLIEEAERTINKP